MKLLISVIFTVLLSVFIYANSGALLETKSVLSKENGSLAQNAKEVTIVDSNLFFLAYCRIGMPGGFPNKMHAPLTLPRDASKITIAELKQLVLEWGQKNAGPVTRVVVITPLEDGDDDRTLENWVKQPTQFQIKNHVKAENDLFSVHRGAYGKWAIDFYYN